MAPKSKTLLQQEEDAQPKKKARVLRKTTTEQDVNKKLREVPQLSSLKSQVVDGIAIDGKTLRDELTADQHLKRRKEFPGTMGKTYYAGKVEKFQSKLQAPASGGGSSSAGSAAADSSTGGAVAMPVRVQMWDAVKAWKTGNREQLLSFLTMTTDLNKAEVAGVLNCFKELKPSPSCPEQLSSAMSVVSWLLDIDALNKFPDLITANVSSIDNALLQFRKSVSKTTKDADEFCKDHLSKLALVVPKDVWLSILNEEGKWSNHKNKLFRICATKVGDSLFGFAKVRIVQEAMDSGIKQDLLQLAKAHTTEVLTKAKFAQFKAECTQKYTDMEGSSVLPASRKVLLEYGGRQYKTSVKSTSEWVDVKANVFLKSQLAAQGDLPKVFCEAELVTPSAAPQNMKVEEAIYSGWKEARDEANRMWATHPLKNSSTILEVLKKGEGAFRGSDRLFSKVDGQFFMAMAGEAGDHLLTQLFFSHFPSAETAKTTEQVSNGVKALSKTGLFKFCSIAIQGQVTTGIDVVSNLHMGVPPEFHDHASSFLLQVKDHLKFFLRSGSKVGADAWGAILEQLQKKFKTASTKASVTKASLKPLHLYSFLVDSEKIKALDEFTKQVLGDDPVLASIEVQESSVVAGEPTSSASASSSAGGAAKSGSSDLDFAVGAMFKF